MFAAYILEIPGSQELMLDWECVNVKDSSSLEKGDHLKKGFSVVPSTELLHKTQSFLVLVASYAKWLLARAMPRSFFLVYVHLGPSEDLKLFM